MTQKTEFYPLGKRFRSFLPVVIDVETGGFNPRTDALLEVAAVFLYADEKGELCTDRIWSKHIIPFEGGKLEPKSLEVNGIDPYHPFRMAIDEKSALDELFKMVYQEMKRNRCTRAILVGHNAAFDLNFLNAAKTRIKGKRSPFHSFSTLDTVSLSALAYGQTVLARAVQAAGIDWDSNEAHSAAYDAGKTAELFCQIINAWQRLGGPLNTMEM